MNLPQWPGWHLIGQYDSGVGSWLLHHKGEAMLLEVPEGLTLPAVRGSLRCVGSGLKFLTASHSHEDHLDSRVWSDLSAEHYPFILERHPARRWTGQEELLHLGGEPLWMVRAPKHSYTDTVVIFRGVAMTGDIELGTLDSVNAEVPLATKRKSMLWLQGFGERNHYHVHSVVSAHLNDVRTDINWRQLWEVQ